MQKKNGMWTWSYHPENTISDRKTAGKWIVRSPIEQLRREFLTVDMLVDKGLVYRAKYTHKEDPEKDIFYDFPPAMCVYADNKTKEETLQHLLDAGIIPERWKYDWETRRDWKPGGELYELAKKRKAQLQIPYQTPA